MASGLDAQEAEHQRRAAVPVPSPEKDVLDAHELDVAVRGLPARTRRAQRARRLARPTGLRRAKQSFSAVSDATGTSGADAAVRPLRCMRSEPDSVDQSSQRLEADMR